MKNYKNFPGNILYLRVCIFFFLLPGSHASAQFTNTPEGRLGLLCKTWGMLKYHHTEVKVRHVNWDSVLIANVMAVKNAATLSDFNIAMNSVADAAGIMQPAAVPSVPGMPVNVDFSWITDPMLDTTLQNKLIYVRDNFVADSNSHVSFSSFSLNFPFDNSVTPNDTFPIVEKRLLYMFRYWNIINYYFPYRHNMDITWDQSLVDLIPLFDTAASALDYHLAFARLSARINDTHAAYVSSATLYSHWKFTLPNVSPMYLMYLNNQTVVARLFANIPGLSEGDIIHKINGMDIDSLRMNFRQYFSASNGASGNRNALMDMMQTYGVPPMQLEVEDSLGNINTVTSTAQMNYGAFSDSIFACSWCGPAYMLTTCGYGYVNMGKLLTSQVNAMYSALKNAPAIIFDVRNYPNGTAWNIASAMFTSNAVFSRIHEPIPEFPGDYDVVMDNIGFNNANGYTGKIYFLVNEVTQSQAEYSVMMLRQMPGASSVKIIGSTTAGADGNITQFKFPGNIGFTFTGLGIYNPDSTDTQRVGIIPDTIVIPTPEGIRHHADEVLLAAFDCLTGMNFNQVTENELKVFPNPGNGIFNIQLPKSEASRCLISVTDPAGRIVFEKDFDNTGEFSIHTIDLSNFANGIYVLKVSTEENNFSERIIIGKN